MVIIDWLLMFLPFVIALSVAILTKPYIRGVADFMSGGRVAGRYILAVASGEMQAGAVVFVAAFELIASAGFTVSSWWGLLNVPVLIIVAICGFVIYRFRETRAMTLAQFFEMRYSRRFRLFTGGLGFVAGILNFGIIPAVGARFLVYFLGLPTTFHIHGFEIATYIPLMAFFLTCTVLLATSGGIVTIMVTNCIEGIISQVFYLVIIAALLCLFKWPEIIRVLADKPPGHSLLNPFDSGATSDFNIWYALIGIVINVYGTMAWQNASGYNSAALTPHESRMGGLLGRWREMGKAAVVTLLGICALTYLQHPDFAQQSQAAQTVISQIQDSGMQRQMRMPVAVANMLPVGIKGFLCAILIMGILGGDATHLHSWGGIFVQDIVLPLRKKPLGPREHIRAVRLAMLGVAVFAFLFGALFKQTEYILMWWSVTTAIYVGGAGAAIIGGLYWKKGTAAGAWAALLTGSSLATGGLLARQVFGRAFPLNGQQSSLVALIGAICVYVTVSLLTGKRNFNLEKMLHRGAYALPSDAPAAEEAPKKKRLSAGWSRVLGFDENFTLADKCIAGGLFGWSVFWFLVVVAGCVWNYFSPLPVSFWAGYWHIVAIGVPILIAILTAAWFSWGGVRDIRELFRRLREERLCHADNGVVYRDEEEAAPSAVEAAPKPAGPAGVECSR